MTEYDVGRIFKILFQLSMLILCIIALIKNDGATNGCLNIWILCLLYTIAQTIGLYKILRKEEELLNEETKILECGNAVLLLLLFVWSTYIWMHLSECAEYNKNYSSLVAMFKICSILHYVYVVVVLMYTFCTLYYKKRDEPLLPT